MLTAIEPTKNLGKLKYGKPSGFNFQIKNQSGREIKINKIVVGCGSCTKASTTKEILQPGEDGIINVTFTPGSTGNQTKHISVRYDESQVLKLEFTAEVYA